MNDKQWRYLELAQRRLEKGNVVTISGTGIDVVAEKLKGLGYEVIEQPFFDGWTVYPRRSHEV